MILLVANFMVVESAVLLVANFMVVELVVAGMLVVLNTITMDWHSTIY